MAEREDDADPPPVSAERLAELKRHDPGPAFVRKPPEGWTPPRKPDLMTKTVKGRRGPTDR